jgi:hypothetical protein
VNPHYQADKKKLMKNRLNYRDFSDEDQFSDREMESATYKKPINFFFE